MFARFPELTVKPEKKPELLRKIKEDIVPTLKKYNGFVDLIPLEAETEPTKFYAISLWHEKHDAEKYHKEYFPCTRQRKCLPPLAHCHFCVVRRLELEL